MEDPQTIRGRPRPTTPLPIQRPPSSGAFTPAHCAPVFPVGQPTPGLARSSCLVCPAVPAIRLSVGCTGTPVIKVRLRRYLPRQRSGHVPLPVGSAPHNPDHSRQRVGISQTGADGSAATSGLDSSHGPSIAYLPPTTKTTPPKLPPQLNISAGLPPCHPEAPRGIWGGEFRSIANHPPQNPRYQLTIGIRRSRPKFLGVIFTPGAACRRLYSFRSTALITRFTISSSNPMPMMSAGDLSCST